MSKKNKKHSSSSKKMKKNKKTTNNEAMADRKPNIFVRFGRLLKRNIPLLLSFLIPVLVMLLVFVQRGIYPFGERCFLRTDLYHQYAPFFKELCEKLQNGESLFYSWDIGNGSNFLALFAYYLSSPMNILLYLCPSDYVIEFISYGIVLKIGLCGFTFAFYLKRHTKRNDFALPMFASFYALSGYMAAYSWNIMWLDCLILFPLVILGLEKLYKEDKCMMYCVSLALCIITNYYIAIMICIAVVLYFVFLLFTTSHKRTEYCIDEKTEQPFTRTYFINYPKKIIEFTIYSLIAGGLSAILLIPAYYALQISASASSTFPKTFTSYFSIIDMLQRHLDNVDIHLGLDHWPNIFCGIAIFIFVPLYIMNKKFSWKEKTGYLLLVLFFFASFSMNFLNYIWHGFHYPNSLPCRQSFIYVFLLLVMAYKGYMGLKDRSMGQISGCIAGTIGFILICEKLYAQENSLNFKIYYVSILFVALYGIIIYLYKKYRKTVYIPIVITLGLLAVIGENFMNTAVTSVTTVSRVDYTKYDENYEALYATAKEQSGTLFFRVEKLKLRTKNDGSWYQYPSISVFSSTANANMSAFYKKLGMESATNAYSKTGATAVIDMLFGIKYEMSNITYADNEIRTLLASSGDVKMYQNKYTLPLGFMVPADFETSWYTGSSNPVDTQNNFISAATGYNNILKAVTVNDTDSSEKVASFTVDEDGYYYAYLLNSSIDEVTTLVKSSQGRADQSVTHTSLKRRFIIDIGYAQAGDTITITSKTDDQSLFFSLYVLDDEIMEKAYQVLNDQSLQLTTFSDTVVEGTINVKEAGLLFTSIAYENGWKAYVDGQRTEIINLKDAMIALELSEGDHTIRLEYEPEGFKAGSIITLAALSILIFITWCRFLFRKYVHVSSAFIEDELMTSEEIEAYLSEHKSGFIPATYIEVKDEEDDEDDEEDDEDDEAEEDSLEAAPSPSQDNFMSEAELDIVKQLESEEKVEKTAEQSTDNSSDKEIEDLIAEKVQENNKNSGKDSNIEL